MFLVHSRLVRFTYYSVIFVALFQEGREGEDEMNMSRFPGSLLDSYWHQGHVVWRAQPSVTLVRDIERKLVLRKLNNKHITDKNTLSSRHIQVFTTETVQPAKSILELEFFWYKWACRIIFFKYRLRPLKGQMVYP